jgi:AcrR family transcriptional regulator
VQLTRTRIITTAMALIEADGPQAVSMTRLATELGCGLIPLYGLVPSTAALLDGIAAAVMAGVEVSPVPGAGWPDQLRAQARAIRLAARAYPRCSVAVAAREPASAAMVRPTEQALATLRSAGFDGQDAAHIVRALAAYLAGSLLREVGVAPELTAEGRRLQPRMDEFPHVTGLAAELTRADPDGDFELGLDLLVRGMDALLAVRVSG